MRATQSPYPLGWYGIALDEAGLGDVRPNVGTYGLYDFAALPPLAPPADLAWLADQPERREWPIGDEERTDDPRTGAALETLRASVPGLPDAFVTFLGQPALQKKIASATACYIDLCEAAVAAPGGGRLVRFLNDQQGCLFWYLYLDGADHAVVVSSTFFGTPEEEWEEPGDGVPAIYFCAETFEVFLYRYWLENEIFFAFSTTIEEEHVLPPAAQSYIVAYRRGPAA